MQVIHKIDLLDVSKTGWGDLMIADVPDASKWDQLRLDGWWNVYCEVKSFLQYTHDTCETI